MNTVADGVCESLAAPRDVRGEGTSSVNKKTQKTVARSTTLSRLKLKILRPRIILPSFIADTKLFLVKIIHSLLLEAEFLLFFFISNIFQSKID